MTTDDAGTPPIADRIDDLITAADVAAEGDECAGIIDRLARLGVERVTAPAGTPFDPTLHRAIATLPTTCETDVNTIEATVRAGWRHRGHMIRYVEVKVRVHR
ncbi:nucleotide exchange factor GrpE [Rhodococcus artemisiae]|uniref:Nucleotide exchange factor GrpE n=1 Tax=Rhodococcus artemisiae TaxID=714159 RepID=A0ABU7LIE6_9NOCA|nr:nucleotide exchange factor GrpE [Rhodococcus artemisiae]MEE2061341.1 nucleotide exchange factor GrpE [Rhodococcus artemisiae]